MLSFARNGEDVFLILDIDRVSLNTRQFQQQLEGIIGFDNVYGRRKSTRSAPVGTDKQLIQHIIQVATKNRLAAGTASTLVFTMICIPP